MLPVNINVNVNKNQKVLYCLNQEGSLSLPDKGQTKDKPRTNKRQTQDKQRTLACLI